MNPEDTMLSEISQSQKMNSVWLNLYEVPRVIRFIEVESRAVVARGWGGGNGELCLTGTEFHFCKMENVLEVDGVMILQQCEGT